MKYFTGVGSRQATAEVLTLMEAVAKKLADEGWWLRSGHAQGSDRAFERGADGKATIYLPWPNFGVTPYKDDEGMVILGKSYCDQGRWMSNYKLMQEVGIRSQAEPTRAVMMLHGRNYAQVMGHEDEPPSKFIVCWCEEVKAQPQGGTASAVNLARFNNIRVFNLWRGADRERVEQWLRQ